MTQSSTDNVEGNRFYIVTDGSKSSQTKQTYCVVFTYFIKYIGSHDRKILLDYRPNTIESKIVGYIEYLCAHSLSAILPFDTIIDESKVVETATMIKTLIGTTLAPFLFELLYIISSNSQANDFPLSALGNSGLSLKPDLFSIGRIALRTAVEKGKGALDKEMIAFILSGRLSIQVLH